MMMRASWTTMERKYSYKKWCSFKHSFDAALQARALACIPSPGLYQASAWAWARPELALGPLLGPGSSLSQAQAISSRAQARAFEPSRALHITTSLTWELEKWSQWFVKTIQSKFQSAYQYIFYLCLEQVSAVTGSLSMNLSSGLNQMLLKLANTVGSKGDASGQLELWSTCPLISMTSGDDLGFGFTSELIHIVVR